jgi:microcystin-dependent protein
MTTTPSLLLLPLSGQTLRTAEYPELFEAIGAHYGGDGVTTFKLPGYAPAPSSQLAAVPMIATRTQLVTAGTILLHVKPRL